MKKIVILGGGFGGVYTAMHLGRLIQSEDELEISIINRENYMVFQPLMPEVVSGSIDVMHCITPIRRLCPFAKIYSREIEQIDLSNKTIVTSPSFSPNPLVIPYDYLIISLGTVNDFSRMPGVKEHAWPFRNIADAMLLRNQIIHVLEEASVEENEEIQRSLLTFVIAGGGFSGVEVAAEIHDFVHYAISDFRGLSDELVRVILVHSGERILPELTGKLGKYAQRILEKRGMEIRLKDRITAATAESVLLKSGDRISARTLISTVPSAPHPLVAALDCEKIKGRLVTDDTLLIKGYNHVWAVGDCANILKPDGTPSPPTAQFAVRQGKVAATNLVSSHRGQKERSKFRFSGFGKAGALGRRSAVAEVLGLTISGLPAWIFWRTLYWFKMPGIDRKIRVGVDWFLDLLLPRDLVQLRLDPSESFSVEHFEANEHIFVQGEAAEKMYVIIRGEVEIILDEGKPTERVMANLGTSKYFGEMALFSGSPRSGSARTISTVDLMAITRNDFDQLVANIPAIKDVFANEIKRRSKENLIKSQIINSDKETNS